MYARLGEIVGLDGSIAVTLAAHQAIGLKVKYLGMLSVTPEDLREVNDACCLRVWEEGLACTCLLTLKCLVVHTHSQPSWIVLSPCTSSGSLHCSFPLNLPPVLIAFDLPFGGPVVMLLPPRSLSSPHPGCQLPPLSS